MSACRPRHVCVIGAGIAGLACALAAAQAGAAVDVFDTAPAPRRIAAHLAVVPNMLRDLVALDLADDCVRAGFPYRSTSVLDSQARPQFEIGLDRLAGVRYPANVGLSHADFVDLLHGAALRAAVRWHWNTTISAADIRWQDGRAGFVDARLPEPDLMVLAAGLADPLRAACVGGSVQAMSLAQAWCYALVARPAKLERAGLVLGTQGQKLLMVPMGAKTAGLAMSLRTGHAQAQSLGASEMRQGLASWTPAVRGWAPAPAADAPVYVRPVRAALLEAPWHRGNLICAGECAVSLPPQFGQGAAVALEHAVVLKTLLLQDATAPANELAAAYSARRLPRARRLYDITTQAARWDLAPGAETDMAGLARQLSEAVAPPP